VPPTSKRNLDQAVIATSTTARKLLPRKETYHMFVYRLAEPIDEFDGLTPLSDWLPDASPQATSWALQAILALADAAPVVSWRGDMRHLPAVGVMPAPPSMTAYLVVKQDNNGDTFVVTTTETPSIAANAAACTRVVPRKIGAWTHPTHEDIPAYHSDTDAAAQTSSLVTDIPF
jgi:hypothetical protein